MSTPTYPLLRPQIWNLEKNFWNSFSVIYGKNLRSTLETSDYLKNRAIVWDIVCYSKKEWWISKYVVKFNCKYGLKITVENLNTFLDYCAVHRFIPIVDKINIEWRDISDIKQLFQFFLFAVTSPWDKMIGNVLWDEINNLEKSVQYPAKEILLYLKQITGYTASTYQYLLWNKLQKLKNKWVLSENIFAEIVIKLREQVIKSFWLQSSGIELAWFKDDTENKTDMHFIFKKKANIYHTIPIQFTISWTVWNEKKEGDVEGYLKKKIKRKNELSSFILLCINWKFSENLASIRENYNNWIENPSEREKDIWNKIPLFVDTIDYKIIQSAEIMYIALNMIYTKNSFWYTMDEKYVNHVKESMRWYKRSFYIWDNGIDLSKIKFDNISVDEIKVEEHYPSILKHKFLVSYEWEYKWEIVVYEVEQKKTE